MTKKIINSVTIITAQGVKAFHRDADNIIKESHYRVDGDPYQCFVVENSEGVIKNEIRCIHSIEIEYKV